MREGSIGRSGSAAEDVGKPGTRFVELQSRASDLRARQQLKEVLALSGKGVRRLGAVG